MKFRARLFGVIAAVALSIGSLSVEARGGHHGGRWVGPAIVGGAVVGGAIALGAPYYYYPPPVYVPPPVAYYPAPPAYYYAPPVYAAPRCRRGQILMRDAYGYLHCYWR